MAIPSYTDIKDLVKKGLTIEAQEKIMELREAAITLQEENIALKERVKALEAAAKLRAEMIWEKPYYWRMQNDEKDGPYCQACYDKEQRLARLQDRRRGMWGCSVCKTTFYDQTYRAQQTQARGTSNWVKDY